MVATSQTFYVTIVQNTSSSIPAPFLMVTGGYKRSYDDGGGGGSNAEGPQKGSNRVKA